MQPLVQKWTGITDKSGKIHTAKIGNYLISISSILNF